MKSQHHFRLLKWVRRGAYAAILGVILSGCIAEVVDEKTSTGTGSTTSTATSTCSSLVWAGFTGTPTAGATWASIQANIFAGRGKCTNCHTPPGAGPSNLVLTSDQYATIVTNRLMSGYPAAGMAIIQPGFKDCSFLYRKISEADSSLVAAGLGDRMPLNYSPLSAADIQLIGTWIDEGAKP
jgi:hypothetical protein